MKIENYIFEKGTNICLFVNGTVSGTGTRLKNGVNANQYNTENAYEVPAAEIDEPIENIVFGVSKRTPGGGNWTHPTEGAALETKVAEAAEKVCEQINKMRDAIFYQSVPIPNSEHSLQFRGSKDFERLSTLRDAIRDGATEVQVIVESNDMPVIPADDFVAAWQAGVVRNSAASLNARTLKNEVLAASTVAEVNAVDITTGWPE